MDQNTKVVVSAAIIVDWYIPILSYEIVIQVVKEW